MQTKTWPAQQRSVSSNFNYPIIETSLKPSLGKPEDVIKYVGDSRMFDLF